MLSITLFVDDDAANGGDGLTWSSAYQDPQDALSQATTLNTDGDTANDVDQIWIAEGVYKPNAELEPGDPRSASFSLIDGVTLYGGFSGMETTLEERDLASHVTTLSGDIGTAEDDSDNAYTVVFCGANIDASLDGLMITGGKSNVAATTKHPERRRGGGIYNAGTLTVTDTTLSENYGIEAGGIFNDGGELTFTSSTLLENRAGHGGGIYNTGALTVTDSTLLQNYTSHDGGGIYNDEGTLTVTNSTLSRNATNVGRGGGIYNYKGTLEVLDSTLSRNLAGTGAGSAGGGGGIFNNEGTLTVDGSILCGNSGDMVGGGIYNIGLLTVTNCTLSGNSVGIYNRGTQAVTVTNSTFSGNYGGGINSEQSSMLMLSNSIFWQNGDKNIVGFGDISASHNLFDIDPKFVRNPSDGGDGWRDDTWTGIDESANNDYGDLRLTADSPAIDYGDDALAVDADDNPLTTDQDGNPRTYDNSPVDVGAFEYQGDVAAGRETASLVVTSSEDVFNLYDDQVTLREAIYYVGNGSLESTITFDGALDGETIYLSGTSLWIDKGLTIDASSLTSLTIDADYKSRIFMIIAREEDAVELNHLTITGGSAYDGGGIYNWGGTLEITNSAFSMNLASRNGGGIYNSGALTVANSMFLGNNSDEDYYGGGIFNDYGSTLTLSNSTLSENSAGEGGGIYNHYGTLIVTSCTLVSNYSGYGGGGISNSGTLIITNSTLLGNTADSGGGIYNWYSGELTVTNSTLSMNTAVDEGGGIHDSGTLTIHNSIVAKNAAASGSDIHKSRGNLTGSHNLIGVGTGQSALVNGINGNLVGTNSMPIDPMLSDWIQFDDERWGYYLLLGSPALDAGNNDLALDSTGQMLEKDIFGNTRIVDGTVDIGSVEGATVGRSARTYLVTSLENRIADDGVLTFFEAFEAANRNRHVGDAEAGSYSEQDVIQFDNGLSGTIVINNGELVINGDIVIAGPGAPYLTFNAKGQNRVFSISPTVSVNLSEMAITGGSAVKGSGIYNLGTLTLTNCMLSGNSANEGGGIYNNDTLTVAGSILSGNSAGRNGGGIYNSGTLTITECTLSDNSANGLYGDGGGIYNAYGTLTVLDSTLSGNSAGEGGGIYNNDVLIVANSTLSGNSAGEGGGVYNRSVSTVTNSTLSGNTVGIYNKGILAVTNSTFSENYGGGIHNDDGSTLTLNNSILWQNNGKDIVGFESISVSQNLIGIDPKFVRDPSDGGDGWGDDLVTTDIDESANDDYGDLRLTAWSPAIDYGDDSLAVDADGDPLTTDLDGNPRTYNGSPVDVGAVEFQGEAAAGRDVATLVVTSPEDVFDLYDSQVTLREAIYYVGNGSLESTITFDSTLGGETIYLSGTSLWIEKGLTIDASSLTSLTIDADYKSRIFMIIARAEDAVELNHLTITGGSAYDGGGIYNWGGTLAVTNSAFLGNLSDYCGGGIYSIGTLTVTNSTLSNNSASNSGGGIYSVGKLVLTSSTLLNNSANNNGGGIYSIETLTFADSTLSGNSASKNGGGIYNIDMLTVTNSTLSGNSADYYGGGIHNSGTLTVTNSTLLGNSANSNGGGIHNYGTLTITNSTLSGNLAYYNGGGISNYHSTMTITNSMLSGNSASNNGGGIYNYSGALTVTNCTLSDNSAGSGGGVYNIGTLTLNNSIVAENTASDGPDIYQYSGPVTGFHNLIGDGTGQTEFVHDTDGNLVGTMTLPIHPMFVDPDYGDYRLLPNSPALDAGSDALAVDTNGNPLSTDLDGSPRIAGMSVDMGAYELNLPDQFVMIYHDPRKVFLMGQDQICLLFSRELLTLSPADLTLRGPNGEILIREVIRTKYGDGWSEYIARFDPLTRTGKYELIVSSTIRDRNGEQLNQDFDNIAGESPEDEYHAAWILPGPKVELYKEDVIETAMVPLTHFDVTFSTSMDQNSFSLDDIEQLTGPDGDITPTGYTWIDEFTLRISVKPTMVTGTYILTLGTSIIDIWGNALDQNQNATTGETEDAWTGSVTRTVGGTITQDMVIPSTAGELVIGQTIFVDQGVTLTIEPGVTLKFASGAGLTVNGVLDVQGTVERPVVFTPSQTTPGNDAWPGIRVTSTGSIDLNHAQILHAAKAVDADARGAQALLRNSVFRDGDLGIYVYSPYVKVIAENCLIANNSQTGIFVRASSVHTFRNCTIVGNGFGGSHSLGVGIHVGASTLNLDNCIVAFNATGLHHAGADESQTSIRNSIFHNPDGENLIWTAGGVMPQLDQNGNMTGDPLFIDRTAGNYELSSGSPAVDSGRGIQLLATDILGRPRYDDQGMPNMGNGYPSFVDIGAYERQENTDAADLAVVNVSNPWPLFVAAEETFNVEWTVSNVGTLDQTTPWQDIVYLSGDAFWSPDDQLIGVLDHSGPLDVGESYTGQMEGVAPSVSGLNYILVCTESNDVVTANNVFATSGVLGIDVPSLTTETPVNGTLEPGEWSYVRLDAEAGKSVTLNLDVAATTGKTALYARAWVPPTVAEYDASGTLPMQPDQEARLLEPIDGIYYVGILGQHLPDGATDYTLSAILPEFSLDTISPETVGNHGTATLEILGEEFSPEDTVFLSAPDGKSQVHATEIISVGVDRKYVTFDLSDVVAGRYDVVLVNAQSEQVTLTDTLNVNPAMEAIAFDAHLTVPGQSRPGRVVSIGVQYANEAGNDLSSPLLGLQGPEGIEWQLPGSDEWIADPELRFFALSSTGRANLLRPGQTELLDIKVRTPLDSGADVALSLYSIGVVPEDGMEESIDWASMEASNRPEDVSDELWDPFWSKMVKSGATWGELIDTLGIQVTVYENPVYSFDVLLETIINEAIVFDVAAIQDKAATPPGAGEDYDSKTTLQTSLGTCVAKYKSPEPASSKQIKVAENLLQKKNGEYAHFNVKDSKTAPGEFSLDTQISAGVRKVETGDGKILVEAHLSADFTPSTEGDLVQRLWFAGVFNADYAGSGQNNLLGVYKDYETVKRYFASQSSSSWPYEYPYLDMIAKDTDQLYPAKVENAFDDLKGGSGSIVPDKDDIAVFYYSGHGREGEILVHQKAADDSSLGVISKITFDSWVRELARQVGQVVIILDSCHSGSMVSGLPSNVTAFVSVKGGQVGTENQDQGGYFTTGFFDVALGLQRAADSNGDGRRSGYEAFKYAYNFAKRPNETPQKSGSDVILEDEFRSYNWVQVISTNAPAGSPFTSEKTYLEVVDSSGSKSLPFYWSESELENPLELTGEPPIPGNGTLHFVDFPSRAPRQNSDVYWTATLIPVKWNGTELTLFQTEAQQWGFTISKPDGKAQDDWPEPNYEDEKDKAVIPIRTSQTPEDKYGPTGYDPPATPTGNEQRFISEDQSLDYRIDFWNKPEAEVPTQDAIIIDRLDPGVYDLSTLEFTRYGFLDWDVQTAEGTLAIDARIDCRPEMNIVVEVKAGLGMEVPGFANNDDIDENTIVWWFHCIDPETGEWPEDPMAGFLPPFNPETEFEIGWVEYTVDPLPDLPSGTQLENLAYVEFDFAGDIYEHPAPKVDPDVEPAEPAPWVNTIDAAEPTSRVETMPESTTNEVLTVRWSGQDDNGGSGIASYDIYVATDDDLFELWLDTTTDIEALFVGEFGHTYAFYSVATDNVGHQEMAPTTADAQITVQKPNEAPTADAGGPYTGSEGSSIDLIGTGYDPDDNIVLYEWDFSYVEGSFTSDATGQDASHTWNDDCSGYIALRVTDDNGASHINVATVTVINVAPNVEIIDAPATAPEGTTLNFSRLSIGGQQSPQQLGIQALPGDYNMDGVVDISDLGVLSTHYGTESGANRSMGDANGDGVVDVSDLGILSGNWGIATSDAPFETADNESVSHLSYYLLNDPGASDTFTYAWLATKDGADFASGNTPDFSFMPDDNGLYEVTLVVTDDDMGEGSHLVTIDIYNVDPLLNIDTTAVVIDEGQSAEKQITTTDVPADTVNVAASLGIISETANGWTWSYTGLDDLPTTRVTITARDEDGGVVEDFFEVTVDNVVPTVEIQGVPESLPAGTPIDLWCSVTDPGSDAFNYTWAVTKNGNDYASSTTATLNFTPDESATYVVSLEVTDDDNGIGTDSEMLEVTPVLKLTDFDVQQGASQRSYIRHLDMVFEDSDGINELITHNRVRLICYELDGSGGSEIDLNNVLSVDINKLLFDFGPHGIGGDSNTTAGDGYYEIGLDLDNNGSFEAKRHFYRLFGDVNGDRTVDILDSNIILAAYGQVGSNLDEDTNGDGVVNALDRVFALRSLGLWLDSDLDIDD